MNMFGRKKVELDSADTARQSAGDPIAIDAAAGPATAVVHEIVSAPELSADGPRPGDPADDLTADSEVAEEIARPAQAQAPESEPEPAVVLSPEMQAEQDAFRAEVAELRAAEHAAFAAAIAEFEREQAEYAQVLAAFKAGKSLGPEQNERAVA
jgi:hypothetical protein